MAQRQHGWPETSVSRKRNNSPQPTLNKKLHYDQSAPSWNFRKYEKLKESLDFGKEYEQLLCAYYALKFSTSDDVVDFEITSNNKKCGVFDDIEIKVTFQNGKKRHYLIQLKHKENEKPITINDLTKIERTNEYKAPFCLWKYVNSLFEIEFKDVICILYTNSATQLEDNMKLINNYENYCLVAQGCNTMEYGDLLLNTKSKAQRSIAFYFEIPETTKQFYFFSQQNNIHVVKTMVEDLLKQTLETDIYGSFIHFMKDWWSRNFVLTKHEFITKIVEMALSPYILTVSGSMHNPKSELLAKAVMDFEMTIVEDDEGIVNNIWLPFEQNHDQDLTQPMLKFGIFTKTLSAVQKSKLLWHLGFVPIIIKVEDFNKLKPIFKFLRRSMGNKRVVLIGKFDKRDVANWTTFASLSDVTTKEYLGIPTFFKVSLQGRQCITLEQLLQLDPTLATAFGTQQLLKMSQEDFFFIGDREKEFDFYHIPRTVTTRFVKTRYFLNQYKYSTDCLVIITCNETKLKMLDVVDLEKNNLLDYLKDDDKGKYKNSLLLCTNCTSAQFEEVCEESKMQEVYLLQVYDTEACMVLMKKGNKLISKEFLNTVKQIKEEEMLQQFESPVNVVCAPPGMGKSRLLQSLRTKDAPSNVWLIFVELIKHKKFFEKFVEPDYDTMLTYFLKINDNEDFLTKIKKKFVQNKQILLFLDGLDEVDYKYMCMVLRFVKHITAAGVKVWMSSRENLIALISQRLSTVPLEIEEFTREDQKEYLETRLKDKYEVDEIDNIVSTIFASAEVTNSQKLLGIPLQLYIITETLLTSEEVYENINKENIFVLTKLYREFFNGKKKFSLEKLGMDQYEEQLGLYFEHHLELYQIPALQTCLDDTDFHILKLKTKRVKSFLVQIKTSGDKHGIIKEIVDEEQAVFVHQTFAEYFACVWFSNHQEKLRWLRESFFSEKYQNLRLIFDVMMAEHNPLHLAVIYRNIGQLDAHMTNVETRDDAERTCFHLVCCHGTNCSSSCSRLNRESDTYVEVFKKLLPKCDVLTMDTLFDFNCIDYAVASRSFFPLEKMLEEEIVTDELLRDSIDTQMMAYYACQFGYPNLLRVVIAKNPEVVLKQFDDKSLLHVATLGAVDDTYLVPRQGNIAVVKMLVKNGHQLNNNILEFVCQNGCYDMLDPLCTLGARCSNGNTILHAVTEYNEIKGSVLQTAKTLNVDIDSRNEDGKTALHIACDQGNFGNIKILLESGAKANIVDDQNRTALHYAVRSRIKDIQIIDLLIINQVDVNIREEYGSTALHDACFAGWFEGVQYLLQHGADPNIVNNYNETVLFKAITSAEDNIKIIEFLVSNNYGFDVNSQCQAKTTLLHRACTLGNIKIVKCLLNLGCDVNIIDDFGTNALHNAADVGACPELLELLLAAGININAQNEDGETPLHLAIHQNHLETVRILLQHGASVEIADKNNANMLHYAAGALNESAEILNELIHANFGINVVDSRGRTPLHYACEKGIFIHGKMLCDNGAQLNIVDFDNSSALHYAAQAINENEELIEFLCAAGLDINAQNDMGQTPIQLACAAGPVENVQILMKKGASIDIVDTDRNSVMHYAAKNTGRDAEIINLLIEKRVEINSTNNQGTVPFQLACRHYHRNAVMLLSEKGANIHCLDNNGMSSLHYAAQTDKENREVIKMLIDEGLNVNAEDLKGRTPLHFSCLNQVTSNTHFLIKRGANINAKDTDDMTVLHYAALSEFENVRVLNYLLNDLKLDVNARNSKDETPLHFAVKSGNYMNVELLLKHADIEALSPGSIILYATMSENSEVLLEELLLPSGFDVNVCDAAGTPIFHTACQNSDYETVKLFIDKGVEIKSVDEQGRNALYYAVSANKPDKKLIKFLLDSGVEINAENSIGSVFDYALEMECYGAVKILLEEDAIKEDRINFLYYSVYSGYTSGVTLFENDDVKRVDIRNEIYPLYFAVRDEQLNMELMLKMTQFVDGVISYFKGLNMRYSHKGFVKYLENQFSSPENFVFPDVDDAFTFHRKCKEVKHFFQKLPEYDLK